MKYFTKNNIITDVQRQTYSGTSMSTMTTVGITGTCYLRPLNEEQSSVNGFQFGLGFSVIVEVGVDIREGDRVTVDSVNYTIQGVVNHNRGGYPKYKKCLALKPQP